MVDKEVIVRSVPAISTIILLHSRRGYDSTGLSSVGHWRRLNEKTTLYDWKHDLYEAGPISHGQTVGGGGGINCQLPYPGAALQSKNELPIYKYLMIKGSDSSFLECPQYVPKKLCLLWWIGLYVNPIRHMLSVCWVMFGLVKYTLGIVLVTK
jgi:hypothetical protein